MANTVRGAEAKRRPVFDYPVRYVEKKGLPTAVLVDMPRAHSAVVQVLVRSGSAYETRETNGTAHFLEHVLLAGSRRYPTRADLQRAIDKTGGFLDAFTHKELTEFEFQVLPGEARRAVELLGEALARSSFSKEAVDSEREIVLEEMLTGNYEGSKNPFTEVLWGTDSVGLPIIGTREVVERAAPADLRAFWERAYGPANMVVVVAGRIDLDEMEAALEAFRGLPESGGVLKPTPARAQASTEFRFDRFRSGSAGVCLMLRSPGLDGNHPRQHIALDLLTESYQTHVYQELVGPRLPVYYLQAGQEIFLTEGYLYFSFNASRDRLAPTLDAMLAVIDRMRREGIPEDELEVNKRMYALGVVANLDDPRDVATRVGMDLLLSGKEHALAVDDELEIIESVSAGEVQTLMGEIFRAKNLCVVAKGGVSWWKERGLRRRLGEWLP